MEALTEVVRAARSGTSASASGRRGRSRRRSALPGVEQLRLEPAAVLAALARARARRDPALRARTASRRSCGRRSPRACSPGSTAGRAGAARTRAPSRSRWAGRWDASSATRCSSAVERLRPVADGPGSRSPSSRSPGCCGSRTSPRRSSAPRGPEQLDENAAASGVVLDAETLAAIDEALAGLVVQPG